MSKYIVIEVLIITLYFAIRDDKALPSDFAKKIISVFKINILVKQYLDIYFVGLNTFLPSPV